MPVGFSLGGAIAYMDAIIAINGNISGAVNCQGLVPVGVQMPAAWDAADIDFLVSPDGVTYSLLYDGQGNRVSCAVTASKTISFDHIQGLLNTVMNLKIHSCAVGAGTDETQTAARTLRLILRGA